MALQERVDKIAQGSGHDDGDDREKAVSSTAAPIPCQTRRWKRCFMENFNEVGVPAYTPEEVKPTPSRLSIPMR